ncbi:helix-turn-helix domain-containing protein [Streptomyces sp. TRM 70361]|uniref:helix-turn-helix transcriptional regulator n=1 Tax=Streptomyces sp. TRM 70361 TaxID=3116553 RepID=UPI002E7B1212|nr:helix-turn-helix domain-containing protein [Streptomyces sp. TRM 70361]MEE1938090.1 helix-turn-helix domain-containing protein [Streptomyces sp. TRM 70361]
MADAPGASELSQRVAARLGLLFAAVQPAHLQRPWTSAEVADRCGVDAEYVRALREGTLPDDEVDPEIDKDRLFGRRLECLLRTRLSPVTGKPYTQAEVARGIGTNRQHIANLRKGANNPSIVLAQQLAEFFGVNVGYFSASPLSAVAACFGLTKEFLVQEDDDPYVVKATENLRLLRAMADKRVSRVVGRLVDRYEAASGDSA